MLKLALGLVLLVSQLSAPGGELPQVLKPGFKTATPAKPGQKAEVILSFSLLKGYVINFTPPITLKLTDAAGVTLEKKEFSTPEKDPKSKDEYYVELPTIKVPLVAAKAGKFEIPGQLKYYFCSKADGFCSVQTVAVKIPLDVK